MPAQIGFSFDDDAGDMRAAEIGGERPAEETAPNGNRARG